jgi:hypothetical protein
MDMFNKFYKEHGQNEPWCELSRNWNTNNCQKWGLSWRLGLKCDKAKKKYMCVYGHPTYPIFQPPTLTFLICNYSTLIFASDPINFYTEFG